MKRPDVSEAGVRAEVREFIEENFLYMHPELELGDEDALLDLGVIDSMGFVELVDEVQERYGIHVSDVEITDENFGSVAAVARFVARRAGS
jgi:acyl carrier protein